MDRCHILVLLTQTGTDEYRLVGRRQFIDTVDEVGAALDHALIDELLERLFLAAHAVVVEELIPETAVDEVAGGVLGTADVEVDVAPVFVGLLRDQLMVVVGIHIAQVIGARSGEARHGIEVDGKYGLLVNEAVVDHLLVDGVPCPLGGAAQWRLTVLGGFVGRNLGQFDGQAVLGNHLGDAVVVIYWERLAPIALAREDGVAQTVVHLDAADALLGNKLLGGGDGLLHGQAVEREAVDALMTLTRRVHHDALLGVEALL